MAESATKSKTVYDALVAFQAEIPTISKGSTVDSGKYSYDYASLDAITPVVLPMLSALGVAYVASPTLREDGMFVLRAELVHGASNTRITSEYPLGSPNAPAQGIGSAITYARRYALLAMTGIAPTGEDDDGAKASAETAKAAKAPEVKDTPIDVVRAEMGALVNSEATSKVSGEDANNVMQEIAPDKVPAQWTLAELKKGRDRLKALSEERIAGA